MDALKFIKQAKRMCHSYDACKNCPAHTGGYEDCHIDTSLDINAEIAVDIVGKWAKEHPEKTRQSEFLKLLPKNATMKMENDVLDVCPGLFVRKDWMHDCRNIDCRDCKAKFWREDMSQ